MKKVSIGLIFFVLVLGMTGCQREYLSTDVNKTLQTLSNLTEKAEIIYSTQSIDNIDKSLVDFALVLSKVVNSEAAVKEFLGNEIGKKFDDDYDVLYDFIAKKSIKGTTLENIMRTTITQDSRFANINLDVIANSIPYLNLAIPVNFDKWLSYSGQIYVIPLRYDEDDLIIKEYVGYDQHGNTRVFDAEQIPDFPVLVVGINERIDYLKHKKERLVVESLETTQVGEYQLATIPPCDGSVWHTEVLEVITLQTLTPDPWLRGNPEFYLLIVAGDNDIFRKLYFEQVDDKNYPYAINAKMFNLNNLPQYMNYYVIAKDYDGGANSITINKTFTWEGTEYPLYAVFDTSYSIATGDDTFGENYIPFWHERSNDSWTLGGATITIGWTIYP